MGIDDEIARGVFREPKPCDLDEISERSDPRSGGAYRFVTAADFDALVAEIQRLREDNHELRIMAEEAAYAENLNAADLREARKRLDELDRCRAGDTCPVCRQTIPPSTTAS